jgi:hypothetical protein
MGVRPKCRTDKVDLARSIDENLVARPNFETRVVARAKVHQTLASG